MVFSRLPLILLLLALTGCASRGPVLAPALSGESRVLGLELLNTPFYPQERYQCGPAALAMVLKHAGVMITPAELQPLVYIPQKEGSLQLEISAASRRFNRIPYLIQPDLGALIAELQAERPVLVFQNLGLERFPIWHYAVAIGYSALDDEVILRSGTTQRQIMPARRFMNTWERAGRWALVILKPGELPALPVKDTYIKSVAAMEAVAPPEILLKAYQAALTRWPDNTLALFSIAAAHHKLGNLAAAEATYLRLLTDHPGHAAALNNLAEVFADRGCFTDAIHTINKALAGNTRNLQPALLRTHRSIMHRQKQAGLKPEFCR